MVVVGIDHSNAHTGLARVRPAADLKDRLVEVCAITMYSGDVQRSVVERIRPTLHGWVHADTCVHLWAEKAPPTARGDVDHGHQGAIGFAQGWLAAAIVAPYMGVHGVHLVGPSTWRDTMLIEAARAGFLLEEPSRRAPVVASSAPQGFKVELAPNAQGYTKVWAGCGHRDHFANYDALHGAGSPRCPQCAAGVLVPRGMSEAEAIRDAWKETACRFVARFWPEQYQAVVSDARSRAKTASADHRLGGVSDACEAVGIAIHGLAQVTP